jgi:hypothetical protein
MKNFLAFVASSLLLMSCTENQRARKFGGTATVDLEPGRKLMVVTWKEGGSLWYLTREMNSADSAETYKFQESSSMGFVEGVVVIKEQK